MPCRPRVITFAVILAATCQMSKATSTGVRGVAPEDHSSYTADGVLCGGQEQVMICLYKLKAVLKLVIEKYAKNQQFTVNAARDKNIYTSFVFQIPLSRINDDFCDCEDGMDEPGRHLHTKQKVSRYHP